jgi:release factor glutamine methyltransferase
MRTSFLDSRMSLDCATVQATPAELPNSAAIAQPIDLRLGREASAIVRLGRKLLAAGYRFTTITPASHHIVDARRIRGATLRDVFGWSRSFAAHDLPDDILAELIDAGAMEPAAGLFRSRLRFSTLDRQIFAHSAFPTIEPDAVFFGPDTYRFARAVRQHIEGRTQSGALRVLDVGAGSGAGGLHAAACLAGAIGSLTLSDINERALRSCVINAALNGIEATVIASDLYQSIRGAFDLIMSNPPYLVDPLERAYRHGGGAYGGALSVRIAEQGAERLAPGGVLLLYTGSAIVDGVDLLQEALRARFERSRFKLSYEEIDPDVFGEELRDPPYDRADRIAAVLATIENPRSVS